MDSDQILAKLRALHEEFGNEYDRYAAALESRVRGCEFYGHSAVAWANACGKLKDLIEEIDPDSLIPVEQPLTWHSDYNEFADACRISRSRGMLRKCLQCSKCKAGMEVEVVEGEPVTKKRIQCSCGHVQLASFFQNGQ